MSQIKVDTITNAEDNGPVYFPKGMLGDASNLIYPPQVLSFDPTPLSTGISTAAEQNITVTFNQEIEFSGVGTISLRQGSATGTELESYTCGVSTRATIAGESLVVTPSVQLGINTSIYLVLPSTGIANTFGGSYAGSTSYFFQTLKPSDLFSAFGGNSVFTISSPTSPTGYHKYHVFTSTGILTTTAPSFDAVDLSSILVAGGGGGGRGGGGAGGVLKRTGPSLGLDLGTYTITIGAGGAGQLTPTFVGANGENSTISTPTTTLITSYGGGYGGVNGSTGPAQSGWPGGSGGGGAYYPPNPGPGGSGIPGQGNPGGNGNSPLGWGPGGGGGGSGGTGSPGNTSGPPTSITMIGGPGGNGTPNPQFTSPILNGNVPTIPAGSFAEISTSGYYGGGGGGGFQVAPPGTTSSYNRGTGGVGGGGNAADRTGSSENGFTNTGGGGGAMSTQYPGINSPVGSGGSGVFMIRYAVPAP